MVCLEGTGQGIDTQNGPGVAGALDMYNDKHKVKRYRDTLASGFLLPKRAALQDNPLGSSVPSGAAYADTPPIQPLQALQHSESAPSGVGIFFQTEPELEDVDGPTLHATSSVPLLPRVRGATPSTGQRQNAPQSCNTSLALMEATVSTAASSTAAQRTQERERRVSKALHKLVRGRQVLVFTDRADVRKDLSRSLLSLDVALFFVKSTNELWHRLRDAKEEYHTLLLDLTKSELQAEPLLRTLRSHNRYGGLPIVALAGARELAEPVRRSCSFVCFLPLSSMMLREALLWCFDRKELNGSYKRQDKTTQKSSASRSDSMTQFALVASPAIVAN